MKNTKALLTLLILPIFFIFLSNLFTDIYSPYYLNYHHDPSYVYLLNFLNLATGHFAGHVEHPGTPLHVIGAVVIKIYHVFFGKADITTDVITRPEIYLRAVNFAVLMLNAAVLYLLGLNIYRIYRNIYAGIFMQLCPFVSINIFMQFSDVNSESFIAVPVMLMLIYAFRYIDLNASDGKEDMKFILIFSVITGLGICTKIILFPLILIPLLLFNNYKQKLILIFLSGVSFFIFFIPGIVEYRYFLEWIGKLFFKSGMYGGGEEGILNPAKFISNLQTIILTEKLFALVIFITLIFLIFSFFTFRRSAKEGVVLFINSDKYFRLLTGLFSAVSAGTLMIAKHYVSRYMISYLMLTIPVLFLMIYISYNTDSFNFKSLKVSLNTIFVSLIIIIIVLNFRKYLFTYEDNITEKNNSMIIHDILRNDHSNDILISGHMEINQGTALHFGTSFTGRMNVIYKKELSRFYPHQIIFNYIHDQIFKLSRDTDLEEMLNSGKRIVFLSDKYNSPESLIAKIKNDYGFTYASYDLIYKDPYDLNEVNLYEIKLKK
ncbi:MAG TPA: hypothetical protein PKA90_12810 [Ignavibacteria bacterium]|nr:hypothetical protein [Ignavibacteria bacterium]HMR41300.1 hypothetical protein [Ignavibacteria bacterium]